MPKRISPPANQANLETCLDEYLNQIKELIRQRAIDLTEPPLPVGSPGSPLFGFQELSQAIDEFAPGIPVQKEKRRWYAVLFEYFPPFTLLCFLLAIIFGYLGFSAWGRATGNSVAAAGFLDITKIFAGAIVGSTSAVAITNLARKKR